jgi:uncharacterized protein with von Willebrand factor type A (vWA) domain
MGYMDLYRHGVRRLVIKNDPFDVASFQELLEDSDEFNATIDEGVKEIQSFSYLAMDLYSILFKAEPRMMEKHTIMREYHPHFALVNQVQMLKQYQDLRQYTRLSEFDSIQAADILAKEVIKILKNREPQLSRHRELSQRLEELEEELEDLSGGSSDPEGQHSEEPDEEDEPDIDEDELEDSEETNQPGLPLDFPPPEADLDDVGDDEEDPELLRRRAELKEQIETTEHELDEIEEDFDSDELRMDLRAGIKEALESVEEISEAIREWGTDSAEVQRMTYHERLALSKILKNNQKLMDLAKMLGRYKKWALGANKKKVVQDAIEVTTIDIGNDLQRVLPQELAMLCDQDMELLFLQRYLERGLVSYRVDPRYKEEEGPIIMLLDESGSMSGIKELWSKGVCIALAQLAQQKNRNFAVIEFAGKDYRTGIAQMRVHKFPQGKIGTEALIDLASHFFSGGTEYQAPLTEALNICDEEGFKEADIVMMTDGECYVTDTWLKNFREAKERMQFKLTSVCVDFRYSSTGILAKFSDEIIPCSKFAKDMDEATQRIFEAV